MKKNILKLVINFLLFNFLIHELSCSKDINLKIEKINNNEQISNINKINEKRKLTVIVYMAGNNDLHYFIWNNIKQLSAGANKNVHIIVQLHEPGRNKKTQLYLIEKNKATLLNKNNQQKLDSGDPQTLIDFCTWSIKNFPADDYMLTLSNHGMGALDRHASRLNPTDFFLLNPSSLLLELDRSIEFFDFLENSPKNKSKNNFSNENEDKSPKGVCFDETYQSYFTNQKLEYALNVICNEAAKILNVNSFKFSIFGMDACLMQMIEIANIIKNFANILVASEEVELGPGWRYDKILAAYESSTPDPINFAKHIVNVYQETYTPITNDFTLSAINLNIIEKLETNINNISEILIEMMQNQLENSVRNLLKKAKSNVAFEEPSYIDIASFYLNVIKSIDSINLKKSNTENNLKAILQQKINESLELYSKVIIENTAGKNIKYATGLSIYFPEKRIHSSYKKTNFAQTNQWLNLLLHYTSL